MEIKVKCLKTLKNPNPYCNYDNLPENLPQYYHNLLFWSSVGHKLTTDRICYSIYKSTFLFLTTKYVYVTIGIIFQITYF